MDSVPSLKKKRKPLTPEQFATALQIHRGRMNMTQREFAIFLGISPRLLWKWLHAQGKPLEVTVEGVIARLKTA